MGKFTKFIAPILDRVLRRMIDNPLEGIELAVDAGLLLLDHQDGRIQVEGKPPRVRRLARMLYFAGYVSPGPDPKTLEPPPVVYVTKEGFDWIAGTKEES